MVKMRIKTTCDICKTSEIVNGQNGINKFSGKHTHNLSELACKINNHISFNYDISSKPALITGSIKETIKSRR